MSTGRTAFRPLLLSLTMLVAPAAVLTGCPSGGTLDTGGSGGGSTTFCDAAPIFVAKCDGFLCHGGTSGPPSGGVELVTPPSGMTLGQSLLNQEATYPGFPDEGCPPATAELIINEATPSASLLLTKLNGTSLCGDAMPPAPVTLTAEELTCINEWVNGIAQTGGI